MKREIALMTALLLGGAAAQSQAAPMLQPLGEQPEDAAAANLQGIPALPLQPAAAQQRTPQPTPELALPKIVVNTAEAKAAQQAEAAPQAEAVAEATAAEAAPAEAKEGGFALSLPELPTLSDVFGAGQASERQASERTPAALPELGAPIPARTEAAQAQPEQQPAATQTQATELPETEVTETEAPTAEAPVLETSAPETASEAEGVAAQTASEAATDSPAAAAETNAPFVASDGVLTQPAVSVSAPELPEAEQPTPVLTPSESVPELQTSAPEGVPVANAQAAELPAVATEQAAQETQETQAEAPAQSQAEAQAQAVVPPSSDAEATLADVDYPTAEVLVPEVAPIAAPASLPDNWRYMKGQLSDAQLSSLPAGAKIQLAIESIDRFTGAHAAHLVVGFGAQALPSNYYLNYNAGRLDNRHYTYVVKAKVFAADGEMLHISNAYALPEPEAVVMDFEMFDMDLGPAI